jgi:macrolide transport system ATP-binding/permease protein
VSHPDRDSGPLIELRTIDRVFELTGTVALKDVSLEIPHGASVAVVGRSGSGKSTLLNVIGLLDVPTSGQYLFEGSPLTGVSERTATRFRRDNVGFVFQSYHLIPSLTAAENVALGLSYRGVRRREAIERAERLLQRVGLEHRTWDLCRTMSGGEQQRVAIARSLIAGPRLLLADEPTGNLDSDNGDRIIDLLLSVVEDDDVTMVVVTHDETVAARIGSTLVMHDGATRTVTNVVRPPVAHASPHRPVTESAPVQPADPPPASKRPTAFSLLAPVREAWVMLTSRRRYLWFAASAVAVAVAMVVASLGLTQSASAQVSTIFDARRARQVHVSVDTIGPPAGRAQQTAVPPFEPRLDGLRLDALADTAGVVHAGGFELWGQVSVRTSAVSAEGAVAMATPGALMASRAVITWAKASPTLDDDEVVLGVHLAERLHVAQLDRAPEVVVDGHARRVVGLLERSIDPQLAGAAIIREPITTKGSDEAWISVITTPGAAPQVARNAAVTLDPYQPDRLETAAVLRPDEFRGSLERGVAVAMTALTVVALLAAVAGIGCMMMLGLSSRTAEFGLRRALGASRLTIATQVAAEAALGGALGGAAGLVIGFAGVLVVTVNAHWRPIFDTRLALIALVAGVLIGVIAGVLPAVFASRVDPAEALRG